MTRRDDLPVRWRWQGATAGREAWRGRGDFYEYKANSTGNGGCAHGKVMPTNLRPEGSRMTTDEIRERFIDTLTERLISPPSLDLCARLKEARTAAEDRTVLTEAEYNDAVFTAEKYAFGGG
jgi:hypothetical protein